MRWHTIAYCLCIGAVNAINIYQGAPWWAIWPTLTWGVLFAVHYFIYKAMNVDENWANERAAEIREYSYDFDHMKDMQSRIRDDHFSLRPHSDQQQDSSHSRPDKD